MNIKAIQELSLGTLNMSQPFDKPFTRKEAAHIATILSDPSLRGEVRLQHFSREGFDGETFHYAGIRRKDGSIPGERSIQRVYRGGLVNLGFINPPASSLDFVKAVRDAGIEMDDFLKR